MSVEVDDDTYPAAAVVYITARWGLETYTGTGFLVGRNDVVTAAHVIYDVSLGGLADEVRIYPSYDPDAFDNYYVGASYVEYYPDFDPDGDGLISIGDFRAGTLAGTERDIALLSLSDPLGDLYGWFEIDWDFDSGAVSVLGHPGIYDRNPIRDEGTVQRAFIDGSYRIGDDLEVNPGNSGGPIFYESGGEAYAIGIVSTIAGASMLGAHRYWLEDAIIDNDIYIDSGSGDLGAVLENDLPPWMIAPQITLEGTVLTEQISGAAAADVIYAQNGDDTVLGLAGADILIGGQGNDTLIGGADDDLLIGGAGYDEYDGGTGIDTAVYWNPFSSYSVETGEGGASRVYFSDGASEALQSVERIAFADGLLALDVEGAAGQAYRLYRAAFAREPDASGLGYWLRELDAGHADLAGVAGDFLTSAEFAASNGAVETLDDLTFVSLLYGNVLNRDPDQGGLLYWTETLGQGAARAEVLLAFSESTENRNAVADQIADGIWYV